MGLWRTRIIPILKKKLVLARVKNALRVDLYAPCRHLIELTVGVPLYLAVAAGGFMRKIIKI
jgi:hypothetical protein